MENKDRELVDSLLEIVKMQSFVPEYRNKATKQEVMGIMVSKYFDWDGIRITETLIEALEDANFHSLAEKIREMISTEM